MPGEFAGSKPPPLSRTVLLSSVRPLAESIQPQKGVIFDAVSEPKDVPPRKVLVGTVCSQFSGTPDARAAKVDRLVDGLAERARREHPGRRLDLVVLPEHCLMREAARAKDKVVARAFAERTLGAAARRNGCYLAAGVFLTENVGGRDCPRNCCVLFDRNGNLSGVYNKVHASLEWGDVASSDTEDGLAPGGAFQVFDTDFGKVGFLVCYDMSYPDGWAELKRLGAEIVAVSSMSPQMFRPALFAHQHQYWVVTATPRAQAAVITPLGLPKDRVSDEQSLLTEIDLSYAICHWSPELCGGESLAAKFGPDAYGGIYDQGEDNGIFWSNLPNMTIGRMIESVNVRTRDAEAGRADRASRATRVSGRGEYR